MCEDYKNCSAYQEAIENYSNPQVTACRGCLNDLSDEDPRYFGFGLF